jgi:hypothetical protein
MFPTNSIVVFWQFCAIKARNRALKLLENDSVSFSKRQLWQGFLVQKVPTFYAIVDKRYKLSWKRRCCKNRSDCSRNENGECFALIFINSVNIGVRVRQWKAILGYLKLRNFDLFNNFNNFLGLVFLFFLGMNCSGPETKKYHFGVLKTWEIWIMALFRSFSMIFACANWLGPETKSYIGCLKTRDCRQVFAYF